MMMMRFQMTPEQAALSRAQLAVKKGVATPEQVALVEAAEAKKAEAKKAEREAAKARKAAAKAWAVDFKANNAEEIEKIHAHNAVFCNYDAKTREYYAVVGGKRYNG